MYRKLEEIVAKKRKAANKETGRQCKIIRMAAGLTQKEMAERTGFKKSNISAFENGNNDSAYMFSCYLDLLSLDLSKKTEEK